MARMSLAARALALLGLLAAAFAQQQAGVVSGAQAPSALVGTGAQQQAGAGGIGAQAPAGFAGGAQVPSGFAGGAQQQQQGMGGAQQQGMRAVQRIVGANGQPANALDILNYALQIAYLEGAFYNQAAFGRGIPDELRGGGPAATGGKKAELTPQVRRAAMRRAVLRRAALLHRCIARIAASLLRASHASHAAACALTRAARPPPTPDGGVRAGAGADVHHAHQHLARHPRPIGVPGARHQPQRVRAGLQLCTQHAAAAGLRRIRCARAARQHTRLALHRGSSWLRAPVPAC
jgi:hypothetical protein